MFHRCGDGGPRTAWSRVASGGAVYVAVYIAGYDDNGYASAT